MKIPQLFIYYLSGKEEAHSNILATFFILISYLPFILCAIIFINTKNIVSFCLVAVMLIFMCLLYNYTGKKLKLSLNLIGLCWFTTLFAVTASPIMIPSELFLSLLWFLIFLFAQLTLILTGLWITNQFWEKTSIESLNRGSFISHNKLINIIELKIFKKARYIWLWITFFFIISFVVYTYAIIYENQLYLGDPLYSFLLSVSLYFGGGNTIYNSIEGLYFSAEIVISFLVNTLYIANVVRLIFEPHLTKYD